MNSPKGLEGLFYAHPEDSQALHFLFEQPMDAPLPLTLIDPFYRHPDQGGSGTSAIQGTPISVDHFYCPHYAHTAHQNHLVRAQSLFFPTTANGFVDMNYCVEDLILEPTDEPCNMALDARDDNTHHEQGNWDEEMLRLAYLPA